MRGSGFEHISIEAGICASGSMEGVLTGKHFNRSMRIHSIMLEAMERLLFETFEQNQSNKRVLEKAKQVFENGISDLNSLNWKDLKNCEAFEELSILYVKYREEIRLGKHGKTSQFFLQYMDRVWVLLRFDEATKSNDIELHMSSLQQLCPLLYSMDHHNYAKFSLIMLSH